MEGFDMTNETCLALRADLVAFLDEELPQERAVAVRAHLEGCAECQAEREALSGAWKSLDLLPGLEPREGLFAEVEARVLASEAAAAAGPAPAGELIRFPFARQALGVAAAALVMAGVGFGAAYLLTPNKSEEGGNQIAVQPAPSHGERPDPIDMGQAPDAPRVPDETPVEEPEIPRVKIPDERTPDEPSQPQPRRATEPDKSVPASGRTEVALASAEWEALDAEEREVVENLDLLIELEEVDELEVLETLEVLDDLTDEELGEG
jgi:putative zinc finger protein